MENSTKRTEKRHPMKVVVRRTGLTSHAIRAWERRYGAVSPARTGTHRRLYSDADIEQLQLLHQATRQGHSIGQVAGLSIDELTELVRTEPVRAPVPSSRPTAAVDPSLHVERCIAAVSDLDAVALEEELAHAGAAMSRKRLLEEVLHPLLERIGELWAEGSLRVAHEHLASAAVRSFLGSIQSADMALETAPGILFTTPAGQLHEIGAMLAATIAATEGWRVTYLGPNLPAEEIAGAAIQEQVRVVGLSIVYPADALHLEAELARLRRALGPEVAILAGGRAAGGYRNALERVGATLVENLADLPHYLAKAQK